MVTESIIANMRNKNTTDGFNEAVTGWSRKGVRNARTAEVLAILEG